VSNPQIIEPSDYRILGLSIHNHNYAKSLTVESCMSVGTGKTLVGVQIAYRFYERNAHTGQSEAKKQVLFCGPSNSSVDVVAGNCDQLLNSSLKLNQLFSILLDIKIRFSKLCCKSVSSFLLVTIPSPGNSQFHSMSVY